MDEAMFKEVEGEVDSLVDQGGAKLPLKSPQDGGVGIELPPGPLPSLPELLAGHAQGVEVGGMSLLIF